MPTISSLQISAANANENTVKDHDLYSATVHNCIFVIIGVLIGLLQITPTKAEARNLMLLGFLVLGLIYVVLIVCEVKLRRNQGLIYESIGHVSHLSGALAASMLLYLIFQIFALVVAILCIFWFFYVMYRSFEKNMHTEDNQSGTANS